MWKKMFGHEPQVKIAKWQIYRYYTNQKHENIRFDIFQLELYINYEM